MGKRLRSPIWWFGGKAHMIAKLVPLIAPHHTYVEPYGGGASLLLAKDPSPVEVYNDLHDGVVTMFRVLRDPEQSAELHRLLELTPYARAELSAAVWEDCEDEVEKARRVIVAFRQSFSGRGRDAGWGYSRTKSQRGMAMTCSSWLSTIDMLPAITDRLRRVQIESTPALDGIKRFDAPETFFYLDPPYVLATRTADGGYMHEMTEADHAELVGVLLGIQGKALLSGYAHPVYDPLVEAGWERQNWDLVCSAAGRTRATGILGKGSATKTHPRTETVWVNYPLQRQLTIPEGGEG